MRLVDRVIGVESHSAPCSGELLDVGDARLFFELTPKRELVARHGLALRWRGLVPLHEGAECELGELAERGETCRLDPVDHTPELGHLFALVRVAVAADRVLQEVQKHPCALGVMFGFVGTLRALDERGMSLGAGGDRGDGGKSGE